MKVTVREDDGKYSIYVAKKDLEAHVTKFDMPEVGWGGLMELDNGWVLDIPVVETKPSLPKTMDARVVSKD